MSCGFPKDVKSNTLQLALYRYRSCLYKQLQPSDRQHCTGTDPVYKNSSSPRTDSTVPVQILFIQTAPALGQTALYRYRCCLCKQLQPSDRLLCTATGPVCANSSSPRTDSTVPLQILFIQTAPALGQTALYRYRCCLCKQLQPSDRLLCTATGAVCAKSSSPRTDCSVPLQVLFVQTAPALGQTALYRYRCCLCKKLQPSDRLLCTATGPAYANSSSPRTDRTVPLQVLFMQTAPALGQTALYRYRSCLCKQLQPSDRLLCTATGAVCAKCSSPRTDCSVPLQVLFVQTAPALGQTALYRYRCCLCKQLQPSDRLLCTATGPAYANSSSPRTDRTVPLQVLLMQTAPALGQTALYRYRSCLCKQLKPSDRPHCTATGPAYANSSSPRTDCSVPLQVLFMQTAQALGQTALYRYRSCLCKQLQPSDRLLCTATGPAYANSSSPRTDCSVPLQVLFMQTAPALGQTALYRYRSCLCKQLKPSDRPHSVPRFRPPRWPSG